MTASIRILHGDCLALLSTLAPESVDSIVADPPYGLSSPPPIEAVLRAWLDGLEYRAKKRGFMGHAWDAFVPGPEVWRECLRVLKPGGHLLAFFGSRTVDVGGLAVRLAGFEIRDSLAWLYGQGFPKSMDFAAERGERGERVVKREFIGHALSDGWGTALKPGHEPIVLARKPLRERTVAAQVLATGTGAINVDACRIETSDNLNGGAYSGGSPPTNFFHGLGRIEGGFQQPAGRWPANVILDEEAAAMLDAQSGSSRFFYCAKASKADRGVGNKHPTVKPLSLMRWLVRLVTPPQGLVLDPFAGSGTTLLAAREEGFDALGIEQDAGYVEIIRRRLGEGSC